MLIRIIGYALVVIAVVLATSYANKEEAAPDDYDVAYHLANFKAKRTIAGVKLHERSLFPGADTMLFRPGKVSVYNNDVYVADWGDRRLKRFDSQGKLLSVYGSGPGDGPGEIKSFTDYLVEDDEVWIVDGNARNVSRFDTSGAFLDRFPVDIVPSRVTLTKEGVLVMGAGHEDLLHLYSEDGTAIRSFFQLVDNPKPSDAIALYGMLLPIDGERLAYVMEAANWIYILDSRGTIIRKIKGIDGIDISLPGQREGDEGAYYVAPKPPVVTMNATVSGDTLSLHAYLKAEVDKFDGTMIREGLSFIDRYDVHTGAYLDSIEIPFWTVSAVMTGDRIYCIKGDSELGIFDIRPASL